MRNKNTLNVKRFTALIFMTVIAFSIAQLPTICAAETAPEDCVLPFLDNVAKFDLAKYNVTLTGTTVVGSEKMDSLKQTAGLYKLESETSKLDVAFKTVNNSLTWCTVYIRDGIPLYNQQRSASINEAVIDFLERYQTYSKDTKAGDMKNVLYLVDTNKNMTIIQNNVKLKVETIPKSGEVSFSWRTTFNGADYTVMSVTFDNGTFRSFKDDRSYYQIGDTTVSVSQEDAIEIALNQIQNFSYVYNGTKVQDFNVVKDCISASLLTQDRYKPLELYPYWRVNLPLNELYPGYVSSIEVTIWADNAEVDKCHVLGFDAMVSEDLDDSSMAGELSPIASPAASTSTIMLSISENENKESLVFIALLAIIAISAVAIITVIIKRRHN